MLALPVQALDLQGLYEQARRRAVRGICGGIALWDRFEKALEDAAALSNRACVWFWVCLGRSKTRPPRLFWRWRKVIPTEPGHGGGPSGLVKGMDDYLWILERDPKDASALYNLANVRGSKDWPEARELYGQAALARPGFAMARSSEAWRPGKREISIGRRRNCATDSSLSPLADARAALSGLLWREGSSGEAESHWAAAAGSISVTARPLVVQVRRWPPQPTADLMAFLALEAS